VYRRQWLEERIAFRKKGRTEIKKENGIRKEERQGNKKKKKIYNKVFEEWMCNYRLFILSLFFSSPQFCVALRLEYSVS
jgi:hypothetical protein